MRPSSSSPHLKVSAGLSLRHMGGRGGGCGALSSPVLGHPRLQRPHPLKAPRGLPLSTWAEEEEEVPTKNHFFACRTHVSNPLD